MDNLKVEMLASVCGRHHSDECQSCLSSHKSNSDRLLTLEAKLAEAQARLDAVREEEREECAKVADEYAERNCGKLPLAHAACIIATAIRERSGG